MLFVLYFSLIRPILEARAEIQKYFCWYISHWPAPPRKNKTWNVIHDSKYQIEEKLGSEMFR